MRIDIHHHYDQSVIGRLETILTTQEILMATQEELNAKLAELSDAITTELQQLADAVAAQAPDLSPQVAKVQELIDALKADDPPAPTVPTEPPQA